MQVNAFLYAATEEIIMIKKRKIVDVIDGDTLKIDKYALKPERIRQNLKTLEKNASKLSGSFGVKFSSNSSAAQVKQRIAEKIETMASRFNN